MSLAASMGGLYGVISVVLHIDGPLTYLLAGGVSVLMCFIAFGADSVFSLLRQSALIFGCGALLGGTMTAILSLGESADSNYYQRSGGLSGLLAAFAVLAVYLTVRLICNVKTKRSALVRVTWKEKSVSFLALCDSGNLLRDPFSGDPVIPLSRVVFEKLCGKEITDALISLDGDALSKHKISPRLIPHRCDGESNIIGALLVDSVTVECNKRKNRVRCLIAPRSFNENYYAGFPATLPYSLLP